jgi:AcrR family transcriptional regulator
MIIEMEKRKYTLRKRAESQEETRARIVEATMALHEEVGPRNTSISAVAERAGVQRLTVYRYFPDETALFQACTSSWLERHPPPPPPQGQPAVDTGAALRVLYGYYRATHRMWVVSYRDVDVVPALRSPMQGVAAYLAAYADALLKAWPGRERSKALRAAAVLSVQFATWRTLDEQGLSDDAMATLVSSWVRVTADRGNPPRSGANLRRKHLDPMERT